ncbi:MAG: aspartate carbamoyltransferase catalytic subunit [Bacillota bacterium]
MSELPELSSRHVLGLEYMTADDIELVLDTADSMREILDRTIKRVPTLRGRTAVNLFYEPSTRTQTSFYMACKYLSADIINVSKSSSSLVKGESLRDMVLNIESMGPEVVIIRHPSGGTPHYLARNVSSSIINAGDGYHEHPSQGLLDLFTMRSKKGTIEGLKVAIIGDILHSRVARSNLWGLTKMGAEVVVCGPSTLIPPFVEEIGCTVTSDVDQAVTGADVVYVLRIQLERQEGSLFPGIREYHRLYGINSRRLGLARPDALLMHPGPMNRGVEITSEVADGAQSVILEQVTGGVAVRMALFYLLLGGGN